MGRHRFFSPVVALSAWFAVSGVASAQQAAVRFQLQAPPLVLTDVPFDLTVQALDAAGNPDTSYQGLPGLSGARADSDGAISFENGRATLQGVVVEESGRSLLRLSDGEASGELEVRSIPGILSLLPPALAIALALVFRQVVVSLFAGIWLGATFVFDYSPIAGIFGAVTHFVINSIANTTNAQIIVFSLMFGGMVGVMTRNGGARGIAELITRYAKSDRGGQVSTMLMALVMFFDDYSNVLVRGNLMRPITDKLRVSREKLSFLVDTGAAAVASTALVSTWIGYEVGLIGAGLESIGSEIDPYEMFIRTIPYRFYPLLAMVLAFLVGITGRDFGPMLAAERRARTEGKVIRDGAEPATETLEDDESISGRWLNGLGPIAAILIVAAYGLYHTGTESLRASGATEYGLRQLVSAGDSYVALLWASLAGCGVAMGLAIAQRIMTLASAVAAWFQGLKAMLMAIVILVLAWSIGSVTEELHAANYLIQVLEGMLDPVWLPVLTFVIAAAMAFATGTSWATMAIMLPLVIPLADSLAASSGIAPARGEMILVGVISSVLAGAVFGDHCSPISDTTILSSMASGADHIDHVRTQLPYALLAALVGMLVGDIPTAFGLSPWISLLVGSGALLGFLYIFGQPVQEKTS